MRTEIFLENNQIDVGVDEASLLTFAIAELQDFASRQTTFSKTIVLPGTANNNGLLGNIFEIGNSNEYNPLLDNIGYNFNASKSASCIIFQDNIQTFKGGLRLLQINIDRGRAEYEVAVFGDLVSLNAKLTSKLLEDLDFSAYNETYNNTNVVASWGGTPGSGVFFPLIDYGTYSTAKHDWDIRTFRPALYAKEYIDKMFAAAGFRYSCALFNTARFKGLIIPHNQKRLQKLATPWFQALDVGNDGYVFDYHDNFLSAVFNQPFNGQAFTIGPRGGVNNIKITYTGADTLDFNLAFTISGAYVIDYEDIFIEVSKNIDTTHVVIYKQKLPQNTTSEPYSIVKLLNNISLTTGDIVEVAMTSTSRAPNPGETRYATIDNCSLSMSSAIKTMGDVAVGSEIQVNDAIPKNVRQIDFFVSILQLFNAYAYEDKFDDRLINITPYVDFYSPDTANSVDWTYKLDRNAIRQIKPMSELNSKIYNFNYKTDGDFYNDLYNKRYGQVYGSYIYDSQFEFTTESNSLELCFSPTPLVGYDGEEKVYSTIFKRTGDDASPVEENADSNIRILQTKMVTGVSSWDIKDGASVLSSHTNYPYAGHFNDPDAPSDDLNFGALQTLFFNLATGNLSATQFNIYWSPYMAEITDKDSKLLVGKFHLTPSDIFNLDFSKYIVVDGVLFRLNKIIDYNVNTPATCTVELLRVIYTSYTV